MDQSLNKQKLSVRQIRIFESILKYDPSITPRMRRNFLSWVCSGKDIPLYTFTFNPFLKTKEVCDILHCHPNSVFRLNHLEKVDQAGWSDHRNNWHSGRSVFEFLMNASEAWRKTCAPKIDPAVVALLSEAVNRFCQHDTLAKTVLELFVSDAWMFDTPREYWRIFTRRETCKILNLGVSTVQRMAAANKLAPVMLAGNKAHGYFGASIWQELRRQKIKPHK